MREIPAKVWWLVLACTAIKLLIACNTTLGNDEVYYWTYAQDLQWNYFDHPPFVAWLIRLTTLNSAIHLEVAVRLGAILSSGICTLLIYRMTSFVAHQRAAWYAALLYASSFYCSIIAGTFILPDSPQMVFWLWSIFLLLKINRATEKNSPNFKLWCLFGLAAGLCILCKVHGIFLWLTVALTALFLNPGFFKQSGMYMAALLTAILISPIVIWNFQHDFITYTYHSERVSLSHAGINGLSFLRELAGQILYNNPFVFFTVWLSLFAVFKGNYPAPKKETLILLASSLPLIVVLVFLSLFRDTLPHWSGPAYASLIALASLKLSLNDPAGIPKIIKASLFTYVLVVISGLLLINFYPGSLSPEKDPLEYGHGDPTLDLYGWKQTGELVDSVYKQDVSKGNMPASAPIVITKWFPAGHLDYYVAPLTSQQTYALGKIFDLHQYYLYNQTKKQPTKGSAAYYIVPSSLYHKDDADLVCSHYTTCSPPVILPVKRNGVICKNILLFRLKGFKGK
ncbi:ArnT family glycosyltransferase [Pedobacter nutrimenti]|jgi:4-amino-4-deoxy-L-arabinose transferase-like glycosyltransferase|uniref:Dolichyl-phosphate-mannose-protein mannosyltransferase n=1 Tax=Pedobacter nutrimenti TaxID=1241337 RepID=A0A318UMW8_9SPHI|nr:glycosyltransferase family 39 protein [Pedobacter nutrimenti]PYF77111.1 dolichyl-phosphate-mannose-protein mannosyltransferase [Pedobacter nutrimenti]